MRTPEHARGTSDPERSGRNAELAKPMVTLRVMIAKRWERISDLLGDLGIDEKPNLTRKILAAEATSEHIRSEVRRILGHELPERAKAGELLTLLAETDADAAAIQEQRNVLQSENGGIVGSFFERRKFENYYADKLDLQTRRSLAEEGLLRAADTFDPAEGELSTYAYTWMKSYIRRAAEGSKKHTRISLDKEVGGAERGVTQPTSSRSRKLTGRKSRPPTRIVATSRKFCTEYSRRCPCSGAGLWSSPAASRRITTP